MPRGTESPALELRSVVSLDSCAFEQLSRRRPKSWDCWRLHFPGVGPPKRRHSGVHSFEIEGVEDTSHELPPSITWTRTHVSEVKELLPVIVHG